MKIEFSSAMPMTLLEEFMLLALDEQTGQMHPLTSVALDCAAGGAVLMDLTLRVRIDNDLHDMFTIDTTPVGDDILDPVLQMMSLAPVLTPHPIAYWLRQLTDEGASFREKALHRLEKRGVLRLQNSKILQIFGKGNAPKIRGKEVNEIKARLLNVILGDEVPLPRDIMLTGLAESCGLFYYLLSETEAESASARIAQVARMDLVGQAVAKGVAEIQSAIAMA